MLEVTLDTETFPNCFLLVARIVDTEITFVFEMSSYRNDASDLYSFLCYLRDVEARAYGFNLVGFDGPIIHTFMMSGGQLNCAALYEKAQAIIDSQDEDRFIHSVRPSDREFEQADLYLLWHFNNRARATSLKALEFNMRMDNISDLPFPVGTVLNHHQIEILRKYCIHDVRATEEFRKRSVPAIRFREQLGEKYKRDFINHSDVKIGSELFQIELEKAGMQCYEYGPAGRSPKQTPRPVMNLGEAILPWIKFETPEFQRVLDYLRSQVISETKGVFDDLEANVAGLTYVFGTGGIHASVGNRYFEASDSLVIESWDVSSYYPNLAIKNRFYPEHLGEKFVEIYEHIYNLRKKFPKGSAENAAYKLSLNGSFGKANDKFSIFYDPLFLLKITLNGQLLLCMLIEQLLKVPTLKMCIVNTDGYEYTIHPDHVEQARQVCQWWQNLTKLTLENSRYAKLAVANVNNYLGVFTDGSVKRKGAYEYEMEWHQDHSALVIAKAAEKVLVDGVPIRTTVENWPDKMDFMCRVKVNRGSRLVGIEDGQEYPLENTQRYYVSKGGVNLVKIMPPTVKKPNEWRRIGVVSGWTVCPCNDIKKATLPVDFDYYIKEVEKLTLGVM